MKKQLIKEAFRLQAMAGIKPINSLNENTPGFDAFMDAVDDMFEPGTPENKKLADAVAKALDNDELEVNQYDVDDAYGQVEMIAKKLGLLNEGPLNELGPDTYEEIQAAKSFASKIMPALKILASTELMDEFDNLSPKVQDYALQMIRPQELLRFLPSFYTVRGDLNEEEENKELSPEQAVQKAMPLVSKLENNPEINKIAADISKDPKALEQLKSILSKSGINPEQLSENLDNSIVQKLALTMAKKAENTPVNVEESDYGGPVFLGFFGGGTLAYYMAKAGEVLTDYQKFMAFSPSHMSETLLGALAGVTLAIIAKLVYDKYKKPFGEN